MKKTEITAMELKNIIALRQLGSNWTKIEDETKVERRAAKRAYEEWKRDEEKRERDLVRNRIQAEAWYEHRDDLIRIAAGLVSNLGPSTILADLEITSERFFASLWRQDLLQRYVSSETGNVIYPGGIETYWREQELLFESLKVHTQGKLSWDVLETDWKNARDKCIDIIPKVRKVISEVASNSILQQEMTNSIKEIKNRTVEKEDPQERIKDGILTQIWKSVYWGDLDSGNSGFETEVDSKEIRIIRFKDLHSNSWDGPVLTFNNVTDKGLAEKITDLCNKAFDTLKKAHEVQSLYKEVANIKKAREQLAEMLNPVKLKPVIFNSRCELCPM